MKTKINNGFTLVELMVSTLIVSIAFMGILLTIVRCMDLNEMSTNTTNALVEAKSKMEEIKNTVFTDLVATYDNVSFNPAQNFPGNSGKGISYVDNSVVDLFVVTVSFSWVQKNGRVIGEDLNLNGVLNAGEDVNGDGILNSKVELVTYIFNE